MKHTIHLSIHVLASLLVLGCSHQAKRENPTSPNFEKNFVTLASTGLQSLRCEVHFPPLKFLANYLERQGQISATAATRLREPYAHVNFFADGTPCLIQELARPNTPLVEAEKTIAHFASVASAATQGSCQMLQLGYLSLPVDFTLSRHRWIQDSKTNDWLLEINGQRVRMKSDFKEIQIDQPKSSHPFVIRFQESSDGRLIPNEVQSYLEDQGPIEYRASFIDISVNGHAFPTPATTTLVVRREGREGVRMATEYSCKPGP